MLAPLGQQCSAKQWCAVVCSAVLRCGGLVTKHRVSDDADEKDGRSQTCNDGEFGGNRLADDGSGRAQAKMCRIAIKSADNDDPSARTLGLYVTEMSRKRWRGGEDRTVAKQRGSRKRVIDVARGKTWRGLLYQEERQLQSQSQSQSQAQSQGRQ